MKDKADDRKSNSEKIKTKSEKGPELKSDKESSEKVRNNLTAKQSSNDKNGMLCPKSVRNQMKKIKETSDSKEDIKMDIKDSNQIKTKEDPDFKYLVKKPITNISEDKTVEILKINNEKVNLPIDIIDTTKCKPNLIYSCNPQCIDIKSTNEISEQTLKHKKKKKHLKNKFQNDSDDCNKDMMKSKKARKSKKKKHKNSSPIEHVYKKEKSIENPDKEEFSDKKIIEAPKSLLVSYSSDEEDSHVVQPEPEVVVKVSPEVKTETLEPIIEKIENKIEIKIKPTKSPGKSAWDSTDSDMENEPKEKIAIKVKSRSASVVSKHSKRTKNSTSKERSESKSKSGSKSHSESRSRSGSHSHSRSSKSRSGSSDSRSRSYSRSHSRSYSESSQSRSRSYSRSRSRSRRKSRHHRRHSSSYSRSHSRYRSRSVSRSSSDSRSSRSYSRSRSRYKSSYSNRYRSRSRSRSSRSRTSYYRNSYRRRKKSSSPDNFLNPQNRKIKQGLNRSSLLLNAAPKPVDISKKIDAIKESQKKAAEANQNLSNLNIPLPPEKPKNNPIKPGPGEWCPSMDFGGPVTKKIKKMPNNTTNSTIKASGDYRKLGIGDSLGVNSTLVDSQNPTDYSYIGPQVSSDMARKLGLDVKASNKKEKEPGTNGTKKSITSSSLAEHSAYNESYLSQALDANHLALQSRAYQHRLNNLQHSSSSSSEFGGGQNPAQYFHQLYMSPSSLTNNLTATALAAVASEQLPASVAGSLAQAAVQRIMSSSNLTATYNTPSVVATPTASYQTALQHTIPASCSTLVANTPSGLVPISLLQQGGMPYGINQLVLQHLQQQALGAQLGQAIAIPNQSLLGSINPLLLQASNQQALLQSLGFGAQTQLLTSPLNFQHTLLMAAQQQQQQMLAAAQLNQAATIQAAQLQAQIQAQARAASFQSLQQAAQMQSSAQNAAAAAMAASVAMADQMSMEQQLSARNEQAVAGDQTSISSATLLGGGVDSKLSVANDYHMGSDQQHTIQSMIMDPNLITSTSELNHFDELAAAVNTTTVSMDTINPIECCSSYQLDSAAAAAAVESLSSTSILPDQLINNDICSSSVTKQQVPRIIYNSPVVISAAPIVTSPVTKP